MPQSYSISRGAGLQVNLAARNCVEGHDRFQNVFYNIK